MLGIVISTKSIPSKNGKKTFHLAELGDGSTVFIDEEQKKQLKTGTLIAIVSKKYRKKTGGFGTSRTVVPVTVA